MDAAWERSDLKPLSQPEAFAALFVLYVRLASAPGLETATRHLSS